MKEWIEEIKKILSEFKEEKEPTIADILIDYLKSRQEAHIGKSRYFYNKDLAVDLKQVSHIVTFLQQRNITTADSLWEMIEEVSTVKSRIDTAEKKSKNSRRELNFSVTMRNINPLQMNTAKRNSAEINSKPNTARS